MNIKIDISYPFWKSGATIDFLYAFVYQHKDLQIVFPGPIKGIILLKHQITIAGSYIVDTTEAQESTLLEFQKQCPKWIRIGKIERCKFAHHDYAIQALLPVSTGEWFLICPHCKEQMGLPTTWTGTKFFCPHCHETIDTNVELKKQFDLIESESGYGVWQRKIDPQEKEEQNE